MLAACDGGGAAERAAGWLWAQQRPDGSFRSEQYAVLRSGQAMTPFVLHALLAAGDHGAPGVVRGLEFLRDSIDADGAIGYADPELLEYPVYATSVAVLVLVQNGDARDRPRIDTMARWLARQQCGEPRGFAPDAPAYGAFGFGALGLAPGNPGHVDVTHTRFALQALAAAGRLDGKVRERALVLLARLQRNDGGFSFSPVVAEANKAGRDDDGSFRAYATATCDGLMALSALGLGNGDSRVRSSSSRVTSTSRGRRWPNTHRLQAARQPNLTKSHDDRRSSPRPLLLHH
jgi:prenyltransferase beta subunit